MDQLKFSVFNPMPADTQKYSSIVPFLLVVGGPTATGKSGLTLDLTQRLNSVVLSADSRQVYREFDIGTAKPSAAELAQAPHYLIDICKPTQSLTLADYQQEAQRLIHCIHQQSNWVPMLVGGTGLYLDAVVKGLKIPPVAPQAELRSQLTTLGQPYCYALLQAVDPISAQRIHPNDLVRTQRALEVFYVAGEPISTLQGNDPPDYPILYIVLDCADPDRLAKRIEIRTHQMVERGLISEVEYLTTQYGRDLPLMQTLGYAEMVQYLKGDCSLSAAIDLTVQHTRQFAKRQRTWFRNRTTAEWFDADAPDLVDQIWQRVTGFMAEL